jgi:hypothetical protein
MTTGESDNIVVDAAELWRAIGRLEGDSAALMEGQRAIRADLDAGLQALRVEIQSVQSELRTEIQGVRADVRDVHRRVDRLFYAVLGLGSALVVAVVINSFVTG